MIRIAIVDDNQSMLDYIRKTAEEFFYKQGIHCELETFLAPETLVFEMQVGKSFDIFLLDVKMPKMDGITLAEEIRKMSKNAYLVFITSYLKFALQGYEVNAYRYILKEEMAVKLPQALRDILRELRDEDGKQYIIDTATKCQRLSLKDVYYMYKDRKNVVFVTSSGERVVRSTLGKVFAELDSKEFIYADRSYVVNIKHVIKMEHHELILRDGRKIPVSRSHLQDVKERIHYYWREYL